MRYRILVINPGSTSTKLACYEDEQPLWSESLEHDGAALKQYAVIYDQLDFRYAAVMDAMQRNGTPPDTLSAVVSRGGLIGKVAAGAYRVNDEMVDVLRSRPVNHHASNLGAAIAQKIASPRNIPAYIYDPVTVDEMIDVVRITGLKEVMRYGQGHNLNMRAAAMKLCREEKLDYKQLNLIVAHLGGGITLSLHSQGRIIDMISDDEGPFSPERAGLIPDYRLAACIRDHGLDYNGVMKVLQRQGGLTSHLGTSDSRKVEEMIASGDEYAALVYDAMALTVSKSIAALSAVVNGKVDRIILTGGIAHSECFTAKIAGRVSFIAPVTVLAGENEMEALAFGALRVLKGEEQAHTFPPQI